MQATELQEIIDTSKRSTIDISDPLSIQTNDHVNLKGKTIQLYGDPAIVIQGTHWSIRYGKLRAMQGVLFDCRSSAMGLIQSVYCSGLMKSKELFRCIDGACYDTHVIGGEWAMPQGMTAPAVNVRVTGPFYNVNSFSKMRFQTNGIPTQPIISLTCTHNANWIYGNSFQDINFEIPNAGAIHLQSCYGTRIINAQVFDADLFGPITNHIIKAGKNTTGGLRSIHTKIDGYFRLSGVKNAGIFDIFAPIGDHYPEFVMEEVSGISGAQVETFTVLT